MTEETKRRVLERVEQILAHQDGPLKTINDLEQIALNVRDEVVKATLEEATKQIEQDRHKIQQDQPEEAESQEAKPETQTLRVAYKLPCHHCQKNAYFKGMRSKKIQTLAGWITLKRAYYHCQRCHQGFYPKDVEQQVTGHMTLRLAQEVVALCVCMPYDLALQTLARLTSIRLSGRSAQRLCSQVIAPQVEQYLGQRQQEMLPLAFQMREQCPADLPTPEVLYIEADGVHTPMRDGTWREMKVGVVRAEFKDGREQMPAQYLATLEEASKFGKHWEALALKCGSLKADSLAVLGDGATWIWNLASTCFPRAVQILDFFHASEYVAAVGQDIFGESKQPWLTARLAEMKSSFWSRFWEAIEALDRPDLESVSRLKTYFGNNASRMDYGDYLRRHLCIGSGLAESSCKRIVSQRLKGSGMRWSGVGGEVIARLRGFFFSNELDAFFAFWSRRAFEPATSPLL
ncbi:ISKra4 family transposase [Armatimonas sp.]|uniref:ISKra4 family transposase n=1 Tax=Armatimonas sp. TaxID=1872638 RepID=UPI00286CBA75|nr:ISKra4 family transposase [Armatimonas sp.]